MNTNVGLIAVGQSIIEDQPSRQISGLSTFSIDNFRVRSKYSADAKTLVNREFPPGKQSFLMRQLFLTHRAGHVAFSFGTGVRGKPST